MEIVTSAPGKIILCGEHAVVYGKEALAFSLSTTTRCQLREQQHGQQDSTILRISIPDLDLEETMNVDQLLSLYTDGCPTADDVKKAQLREDEEKLYEELLSSTTSTQEKNDPLKHTTTKLILILFMHLVHSHLKKRKSGLSISYEFDLPIGAGLGSSASFAVATVSAMLVYSGVLSSDQQTWSDSDYELINSWAYQSEKIVHGTPSGIDNSIATYGQCVSFKSKKIERLQSFCKLNLKVLVIDTKRSRSTKTLVEGVRERNQKFTKVYCHIMEAIEQVTEKFKENLSKLSEGESNVDGIFKELEELIDINQNLLNAIGVGHPTITDILTICSTYQLHAKLTGAGGGGCVFALIPPSYPEKDLQSILSNLNNKSPFKAWTAYLGGEGIKLQSYKDRIE